MTNQSTIDKLIEMRLSSMNCEIFEKYLETFREY